MTLSDEKVQTLKTIFGDMNNISLSTEKITKQITTIDDAGIIPKFAGCQAEGVSWFKTCGLWKDRGFSPKPGDIIFFDWSNDTTGARDNSADHVGIVEKVDNGKVYTIEGNSSDSCRRREYDINSSDILGYGTPLYN